MSSMPVVHPPKRDRSLTIEKVAKSFRKTKPKDVKDALQDCGVTLRYLASGAFRDAYEIVGLPLVVKFPSDLDDEEQNMEHSRAEMRVLKRLVRSTKKYVDLHPFLPKVYYSNGYGVVLMRKYTPLGDGEGHDDICGEIEETFKSRLGNCRWANTSDFDCHTANIGCDEEGNYVIMDLGCFEPDAS